MNDQKIAHITNDSDDLSELARRRFLQAAGALGAGAVLQTAAAAQAREAADKKASPQGDEPIPRRSFGKSGVRVSILAVGGHHLGDVDSVDDAIHFVHEALDGGVNFFDNCWEYHNGRSEDWMGRGLRGHRDEAFLMTKVCTHGRGKKLALRMLDESLRRLQTDHLDLWQVHGMGFDNDPDLAYAKGGVLEALDVAKQQGKVRYVGFTGHKSPDVHHRMITLGYPFDSVQMPLNPFDATFHSFEQKVLPEANRRGIAVLGMKCMGGTGAMIEDKRISPDEALQYAMSLPVTTTISGMDSLKLLRQNLNTAREFKPLTDETMQKLRDRCAELAGDGRYELYKVSLKYDNPHARLPHGFPIDDQQREVKEMLKGEFWGLANEGNES